MRASPTSLSWPAASASLSRGGRWPEPLRGDPSMNAPERAAFGLDDFAPFGDMHGPLLTGPFAPVADESVWTDLPLVKGAIPADLNGVYLRAGPNPRFEPLGRYHPFDGDGMVHAAEFRAGRLTV